MVIWGGDVEEFFQGGDVETHGRVFIEQSFVVRFVDEVEPRDVVTLKFEIVLEEDPTEIERKHSGWPCTVEADLRY